MTEDFLDTEQNWLRADNSAFDMVVFGFRMERPKFGDGFSYIDT